MFVGAVVFIARSLVVADGGCPLESDVRGVLLDAVSSTLSLLLKNSFN